MLLNHLAAILFFAGPLFYIGLWMAIDPAALIPRRIAQPRRLRTAVRLAGILLLLFAIAL
jgi:hypothetical protein